MRKKQFRIVTCPMCGGGGVDCGVCEQTGQAIQRRVFKTGWKNASIIGEYLVAPWIQGKLFVFRSKKYEL